jgi:DNA ligase-1
MLQRRLGRTGGDLFLGGGMAVHFRVFDILHHDGAALIRRPLIERRAVLDVLSLPTECVSLAPVRFAGSAAEIDVLFERARAEGFEGLMLKDPASVYSPGRRGLAWIKLKKAFATLDTVIVAAEFGHGKRAGVLSDYTFAVRDGGRLLTIGKAYSGLTDAEIASLTERLMSITISREGNRFAVRPEIVLEIAFDSLQPSERHESGLAMRFPRIVRIRDDKTPEAADTLETARRLAGGC